MHKPADHPAIASPRIGVLLVNLGSPAAPDTASVRRYLRQFLSDPRVVEIPQIFWQPILRLFVLTTRPARSAHAYQQIWTQEGAPLVAITRRQAEALDFGAEVMVRYAMRYGEPAIADVLGAMKQEGCERILIAPLYPQYSAATTATVMDEVARTLAGMRWQPSLRSLPPYYDDPLYIEALAASVQEYLADLSFQPDIILASFHSMPERTLLLGDPYHCQCRKTARLLSELLGRPVEVSFQSRLGRAKWLEPSTEETLAALARQGQKKIAVLAPGFSADNLETLEEVAIRGRETFLEAGGGAFAYIPCLNDSPIGIKMLQIILGRELEGWVTAA